MKRALLILLFLCPAISLAEISDDYKEYYQQVRKEVFGEPKQGYSYPSLNSIKRSSYYLGQRFALIVEKASKTTNAEELASFNQEALYILTRLSVNLEAQITKRNERSDNYDDRMGIASLAAISVATFSFLMELPLWVKVTGFSIAATIPILTYMRYSALSTLERRIYRRDLIREFEKGAKAAGLKIRFGSVQFREEFVEDIANQLESQCSLLLTRGGGL